MSDMDDAVHRENGRHKPDHYKAVQTQWMIPQNQVKDPHLKIMSILAERDNAIHDRNLALAEKKAALAERDMAIIQRDAAIVERDNAIIERDDAIAALECARENVAASSNFGSGCPHGCQNSRGFSKNLNNQHYHVSHVHSPSQLADTSYNNQRNLAICEAYPISAVPENGTKPRKMKRPRKESKSSTTGAAAASKKPSKAAKCSGGGSRKGAEDLNKQQQVTVANWRGTDLVVSCEDLNKEGLAVSKHDWKGQDLGLNHVTFDETTMPVPGCSCTGNLRQCYKWGNGGWQSACCTTTVSAYPLPTIPNKRHARIGGRKMSGGAFTKLLSRLAREGYDLSMPLDLKNHWAKHGTNRYITIK